jgi:hypothetical protein
MFHLFVEFLPSVGLMGLKLLVIASLNRKLGERIPNFLGGWLASWLTVHTTMVAAFLALSAFQALTPIAIWILFSGAAALLHRQWGHFSEKLSQAPGTWIFFIIFGAMVVRASISQEFTLDAQSYGLARLGLWMNYRSVLVHMPTEQLNIFSNEWNGELIALSYGLAAHSIQGFMLGNVEVLLVFFLAASFLSRALGAPQGWASLVALLAASSPAVLGLTGTLKGDGLAVAATLMAAGWLISFTSHPRTLTLALVWISATLAVSSKITAGPVCGLIFLAALLIGYRALKFSEITKALGISVIFSIAITSRFTLNWIFYNNPFKRTGNETISPSWDTFTSGITYISKMIFSFSPPLPGLEGASWLLAGGLGVSGFATAAIVLHQLLTKVAVHKKHALLILIAALGLVAEAWVIPTPPYAFRYFLPGVTLILVCLCSFEIRGRAAHLLLSSFVVCAAVINFSYVTWTGEINANRRFTEFITLSINSTPLERSLLHYPPLSEQYGVASLNIDKGATKEIAVHAYLNRPTASLLGSRAQNRLVYFENEASLIAGLDEKCFDLVALSKKEPGEISSQIRHELAVRDFEIATDGDLITMARATQQCIRTTR